MKNILIVISIAFLASCSQEPPFAGSMSISTICSTAGYIIKNKKGKNFKVHSAPCKVGKYKSGKVRISSGYTSPLGPSFQYKAIGSVIGNTLYIEKIKVLGIDEEYVNFSDF